MDENDDEKIKVLESIRLQEEALSLNSKIPLVNLDDLDSDEETESIAFIDQPTVSNEDDIYSNPSPFPKESGNGDDNDGDDDEPTISSALSANLEYDKELGRLEAEIKLQIENVEKQIADYDVKIKNVSNNPRAYSSKSNWLYPFGMPYFKDKDFYPCPHNKDYKTKQENKEICWVDLPAVHQWMPDQKRKLVETIRMLSYNRCIEDAELKLKGMKLNLSALHKKDLSAEAEQLESEISAFDVRQEAMKNLQHMIENGPHDWLVISNKYLEGKHPPSSCEAFWKMYLHPKINKAPWSHNELERLKEMAQNNNFGNWDLIAEELGNSRTGYQCFITFQTKLNDAVKRNVWTEKEDLKLYEVVEKCRIGDYIPWGKVSFYMDGRTKTQIFNRWTYSLNPSIKKGRFTNQEDILIIVGVQMWGEDFQRISNFIQDRTTSQVRDRFRNYLSKTELGIPWNTTDDALLISLVDKHGREWRKIAGYFPNKDRTQVRHRYNTINKWKEKNPDKDVSEAPVRTLNQNSPDNEELWEKARSILTSSSLDEIAKSKAILSSCFKNAKKKLKPKRKKEKAPTLAETDLINFFRCSYHVPGGRKKSILRVGEAEDLADDLKYILELLDATLHLPSSEEIVNDLDLNDADRAILEEYRMRQLCTPKSPQKTPADLPLFDEELALFDDNLPSDSYPGPPTVFISMNSVPSESYHEETLPGTCPNIDYQPPPGCILSNYVELPILNFTQDQVVVDTPLELEFPTVPSFDNATTVDSVVGKKSSEKSYVCPPNFTTLVGLRTFLLNRRSLADRESIKPSRPFVGGVSADTDDVTPFEEARKKFEKRLLFLFLWPAIMSRSGPENTPIFSDENTEAEGGKQKTIPCTDDSCDNVKIVCRKRKIRSFQSRKNNSKTGKQNDDIPSDPDDPEEKRTRTDTV